MTLETLTPPPRNLESPPVPEPAPRGRRIALTLAAVAFIGAATGGAVTSTGSGLADPHWPTFGGRLVPPFEEMLARPDLLLEHGHRLLMGASGVLAAVVALCAKRWSWPGRLRKLAWAVAGVWLLPAVLGGLTVLYKLPPQLSILHVSLAMLFLSGTAALAAALGKETAPRDALPGEAEARNLFHYALGGFAVTYVQVVLGSIARHATDAAGGRTLVTAGNIAHILWAFVAATVLVLAAGRIVGRFSKHPRLLRPAAAILLLVVVQFFLGFTAFAMQPKEPKVPGEASFGEFEVVASLHQVGGLLLLVAVVVLAVRAASLRAASLEASKASPEGGGPS